MFTHDGIIIFSNPEPQNAKWSIFVTLSGISMVLKDVQPMKAPLPMLVIL